MSTLIAGIKDSLVYRIGRSVAAGLWQLNLNLIALFLFIAAIMGLAPIANFAASQAADPEISRIAQEVFYWTPLWYGLNVIGGYVYAFCRINKGAIFFQGFRKERQS